VECIHLTEDRDKLHEVVNTVMNFRFHKIQEISRPNEELLSSEEGLCLRSSLFCDIMQRLLVVSYRRFRTTYRFHLQGSWTARPLKMESIGCPETSGTKYLSTCISSHKSEDIIYTVAEA
jgi:hypothetical protein